jgi:hypothetical protein
LHIGSPTPTTIAAKGLLIIVKEVKMLNKRKEKGCKGKEDVVEINVQCAKSLQVHANSGGPTKKTQGSFWRLLNKKMKWK